MLEIEPFDLLLKDFETLKAIKPFIFSPVTSEIEDLETYWDSALYYLDKGYAVETYYGSSYKGCPQKRNGPANFYFAIIWPKVFKTDSLDELVQFVLNNFNFDSSFAITDRSFLDLYSFSFGHTFDEPFMLNLDGNDLLEKITKFGVV